MNFSEIYKITLVLLLIACAVSVNLTRSLLRSVIIFMSYSSIMCLLWILMESPDLAITEAAVGAGVSGYLFLVTLKKLRQIDGMEDGQREGGAWTDTAPEMEGASAAQAEASQTQADGGAAVSRTQAQADSGAAQSANSSAARTVRPDDGKRRRGKRVGKRKDGGQ